ncbi:uncharacterized protein LOC119083277 [Bradysia coprophila]|uniref:uncharacterized protein LOC119083277 n=1 Tax=Bradysia coprophila TaxID=38358 RepID=UPI00187DC25A|nr:uncharacterized protein LOC119083277 [Bradysia coprophila]
MTVCRTQCREGNGTSLAGSDKLSGCCSNCPDKMTVSDPTVNAKNPFDHNSMPNCKLSKSNILDKLHFKLNQLNKLNAHVQRCNDALENSKLKRNPKSFQSKMEFENFLRKTYNDNRYSYCILNCGPSVPHRQLKAMQVTDTRIPKDMGWNWKITHSEDWQPGKLPKIIKMRMSHFLNYYPCDTLPITRCDIKLSKTSFNSGDELEWKIKKMIQSMGFSPCICTKSIAWCTCRDKNETTKLKKILNQIEQQIGESGLEYKLYLNEMNDDNSKKITLYDRRTSSKSIPDLIHQETQYEPMDFKIKRSYTSRLSKPKTIETKTAKPNNSAVTVSGGDLKTLNKKSKK